MSSNEATLASRAEEIRQRPRTRQGAPRQSGSEDTGFPLVMRGYERAAVDQYVEQMNEFVAELKTTRTTNSAVKEALDQVGEETSSILQRAHETAEQITSSADAEARGRLDEANREADRVCAEAEARARTLESDTRALWDERAALIEDTRKLAESLLDAADSAIERLPERELAAPATGVREFEEDDLADDDDEQSLALHEADDPGELESELAEREQAGGRVLHGVAVPPPPAPDEPLMPARSLTPPPPPPPPPPSPAARAGQLDRPTEQMDVLAFVEREQGASARFKSSQAADFMSRWRR